MMAATVADLKPINHNWTFVADDVTASGTTALTKDELYAGDQIFTPTGNSVSASKGQSTINGQKYYNSLRIKNAQDRLAFAVYDACTITFYTQSHASRGLLVSTMDNNVDETLALAKEPVSTTEWTIALPAAGTYYLTSHGGDFFLGGFTVEFEGGGETITEYVVTYVNTDGTIIGYDTVPAADATLSYKYGVEDVTVAEGKAFRGWFNAAAAGSVKVAEGTAIENDMRLYAQATDIETAETGKFYIYDLTKPFYQEDHECVSIIGASYSEADKGWKCEANAIVKIVAGPNVTYVGMNDAEAEPYSGNDTLTLSFGADYIIKTISVFYVQYEVGKDDYTGYYVPAAGDGAALLMVLNQVKEGEKIFLPNGVYDFGTKTLTEINKNNVSIIGQSMEGVIIKNAPLTAHIGTTATLRVAKNVSGTYLQDLTIQNNFDYYKTNEGQAVALWDQGTKTVCKNVRLLSYQDTYYSNLSGAVKYFENCEIHGTVDFICGDGNVYFYGTELVCEQRYHNQNGGGSDAVTASNADANDKGYVFDYSTIRYAENIEGTKPVVSLGRSWNNSPKCVFLNTFLDDSNGELNFYKDANAQKDKISRWTLGAMNALPAKFGEFHSVNANGEDITPESNNVTFVLGESEKPMETILTADEAATYTIEYTLGEWAATAKADATQAVCDLNNIDPAGAYLIEDANGQCFVVTGVVVQDTMDQGAMENLTVRKANARGGFGAPAGEEDPKEGLENTAAKNGNIQKIFRDGQVVIVRDGKEYNVLGAEL